jgi:glycosyltransferase involved in cell wall biosynthesis
LIYLNALNYKKGAKTVIQERRLRTVINSSVWQPADCTQRSVQKPLVQAPMQDTCRVSVIVPVRDEAATLTATLAALANQVDLNGGALSRDRYEIILLANNCCDHSASIARQYAACHPDLKLHVVEKHLPLIDAHIGRVRQMLMDEAYQRFCQQGGKRGKRGIIASTDGDSQVSPTWIAAILHEIAQGADAVGGRIVLDPDGLGCLSAHAKACHLREVGYRSLIAELESYLDPDPYDPAPRHYQNYGASLAVTAEIYAQAGGMPLVRSPEDVALYQALLRVNARFRHSPIVRVVTSARQTGRTSMGLANQLSVWTAMGQDGQEQPFMVEPSGAIVTRLCARQQLRKLWGQSLNGYQPSILSIMLIANALNISTRWLNRELLQPQTFGLLFERIEARQHAEGNWAKCWKLTDIREAIIDLRQYLGHLRNTGD